MGKVRVTYEAHKCEAWEEGGGMGKEEFQTKPFYHHPRQTASDFWIQKQERTECGHPPSGWWHQLKDSIHHKMRACAVSDLEPLGSPIPFATWSELDIPPCFPTIPCTFPTVALS